ncbi:MAG: hypothetical protein HY329_23090 [Chloroflexi bacterium]|nr:hypothetical protein [Chloroflexota bacterium]
MRRQSNRQIHFEETMPIQAVGRALGRYRNAAGQGGRSLGWVVPLLLVGALLLVVGVGYLFLRSSSTSSAPPAPAAKAPPATNSVAKPAPTPAIPKTVVVGNTGGDGVYVRRTPNLEAKIQAWPDGTKLTVLGPDVDGEGQRWRHVKDPAGNEGYVPSRFTVDGG